MKEDAEIGFAAIERRPLMLRRKNLFCKGVQNIAALLELLRQTNCHYHHNQLPTVVKIGPICRKNCIYHWWHLVLSYHRVEVCKSRFLKFKKSKLT